MAKKKFKELIKDLVFNNPRADREFPMDGDDPDIDKKVALTLPFLLAPSFNSLTNPHPISPLSSFLSS